ncbi:MAG: carbohydrate binding family 9 domain-containing protein [Acidobacteria bacterium]|nr:carbohydrate binding family 9 domain-containing protein [Acidobacteriota bacterium]
MTLPYLLMLALAQAAMPPQTPATVDGAGSPTFSIPRVEETVVIDGRLDEPAWSKAARLTGFSEYRPVDSQRASERTEVLVWYSPEALHFGIIAHDSDPSSVRATQADRDNLDREDSVRIYLDTFNDRRRAFVFGVNPLGAQEDGVQTEGAFSAGRTFGGVVDLSPDYQFDSRGQLTPEGYVVEVRIPFKSLRYPSADQVKWGINVLRKTQRTGREDTWTDAKRVASFLGQTGTMTGLYEMKRGVVTEVQPFVTGATNGTRQADGRFSRSGVDIEPGVNVRLGFTNLSLDATVNPDFSQVESDAAQVTVNERFALFFAEKRPFFLEGIELFATPGQLVYTRRIADPIAGAKFTGKVGRTGLAFLSAMDEAGPDWTWVNLARIRRDVGRDSLAGVTYTDRTADGGSNRVLAADARIVFKQLYYVLGQVGGSWTDNGSGAVSAPMWNIEADRTARTWGFHYKLGGLGEGFEAASGFVPRNNIVEFQAFNRLSYYGKRGSLVEGITTFAGPTRIWRYADFGKEHAIEGGESLSVTATMRGGWSLSARPARDFVHFDPSGQDEAVTNFSGTFSVTTPVFERFNAKVEVRTGGTAIFAESADGRETRVTTSLGLRPTQSARIEASFVTSRIHRALDDTEFARSTIPRLKAEYQPRRSLFFRVIAEYRSEVRAGETFKGLRTDWLLSFEPTPGTVVFLGYGASQERDPNRFGTEALRRTSDGFFVKLAYQFRR